ncbi:MAG: MFS transporter, partial [Pseudomonadales bacterium]
WHAVFIVIAIFCALMLAVVCLNLPETLQEPVPFEGIGATLNTFKSLLSSGVFSGYAFCVSFVSVIFFSFISAAPEIMVSVLNRPATEYGYYFILIPLGFIAGNFTATRLVSRHPINKLIGVGAIIGVSGIVLALLLQLAGLHQPIALFAPIALAVYGNGITLPNAQAAAINEFPKVAGSASGLTGFLQMACSAIAAQLVAIIYNGTVYPLLAMMLVASLLSVASFWLGVRHEVPAKN